MTYKFHTIQITPSGPPLPGEMSIVTIPIQVIFEWSDKIIADADYDENGSIIESSIEYKSGWIMIPLPNQRIVYTDQDRVIIGQTFKEK